MIRILVADDHSVVRKGLKLILEEGFPGAEVVEVSNAEETIEKVMQQEWDVVISDLSMPGRSGLDALQQIKVINNKIPVLILSIHPEEQYAMRALKSGASGYLNKEMAPDELVKAVTKVMSGKKYITASIAEKLASVFDDDVAKAPHDQLSDREFSVMKMIASGKSLSDIADSLFLSVTTVSTYRSRIMSKMKMKNNAELILYAIEKKLI